ncbi:hypothetical protein [Gracilinema caldarium]|uniref:ParB/Sulfiredoxin domain-containing protein n=1 Tax=Gracilinema caldarium (strain ATCC 51460 / DSM 7334 / H1) TaxID=744872 RepID=F8F2Z7_GRAC1|nr:hypothetical protein [Gracilinema caldarium]AEJ19905.1 hypothetical protein Spica_1763 [Gracilinema caldarium DSM 7334]
MIKMISINDLLVNPENYRYTSVESQKEAIDLIVSDQKEKLLNLAKHIMENGLNPNDLVQVSPYAHDKTKYIVIEGNRRVVALKLLNTPTLVDISGYERLRDKFQALKTEFKDRIIDSINCSVYADPSDADKWIKLKHAGQSNGIGTVDWDAQQIQRFEEKVEGKSSVALQILNFVKSSSQTPNDIIANIGSVPITSLSRLVADPDVRRFIGIEVNNGLVTSILPESEVLKGLIKIISDLLSPDFKVKRIYTKDDRQDYVKSFPKKSTPDHSRLADKPWLLNGISKAKPTNQPPRSTISKDRKTVIPRKVKILITNSKVNAIYEELKKLDVNKFTNACAVLLRVFVELSLDCYIYSKKPAKITINSKLREKVQEISSLLESTGIVDKYITKGVRDQVAIPNGVLSMDTLNAYIHNPNYSPIATNVVIAWDNIQVFMERLWADI